MEKNKFATVNQKYGVKNELKYQKMNMKFNYLVCKNKYKHLLHPFEKLFVHTQCDLDFDGLGYLIRKVSMVNLVNNK